MKLKYILTWCGVPHASLDITFMEKGDEGPWRIICKHKTPLFGSGIQNLHVSQQFYFRLNLLHLISWKMFSHFKSNLLNANDKRHLKPYKNYDRTSSKPHLFRPYKAKLTVGIHFLRLYNNHRTQVQLGRLAGFKFENLFRYYFRVNGLLLIDLYRTILRDLISDNI